MSDPQPKFTPGLELSARFFSEVVKPILADAFPDLVYSAALIGPGSEVLGYDTVRSTDHGWGPRLQLFVADDNEHLVSEMDATLSHRLPFRFLGYSTNFGPPDAEGTRLLMEKSEGTVDHKIEIVTIRGYFEQLLGLDPRHDLSLVDWLTISQQALLGVTAGRVYHDGLGELAIIRTNVAYYPHDVWLYLLAAQWQKISQQEAFVGRTGEVEDEIGSALIAAALVRDLMHLCFLIERRYAPYSKWFGTAFRELECAAELEPLFHSVLEATSWQERERPLGLAYEAMARRHNALGITPPVDPTVRNFYSRPFQVLHAERFVAAMADVIESPEVNQLIESVGWIGGIDQITDNVDLKTSPALTNKLRAMFG
jgi:uncharacterized protein DUF4037